MLTQIGYAPVFMFIAITLLTVFLFLRSVNNTAFENPAGAVKTVMIILFVWLSLQGWLGFRGGYRDYTFLPPKIFLFGVAPALLFIISIFIIPKSRNFILKFDLQTLTWLHTIRIPMELGLLFLCYAKFVPGEMTFEGRNFDIISGLTAPLVAWLVFRKKVGGKKLLLIWNIICFALLFNIIITAILSLPYSFQKFGIGQPNVAVLYFPFVWLPTVIVPVVFLSHLIAIARLLKKEE